MTSARIPTPKSLRKESDVKPIRFPTLVENLKPPIEKKVFIKKINILKIYFILNLTATTKIKLKD